LLFVCLFALSKNFRTNLNEIFREGWQWANGQMIKFWWRSGPRKDPDRDHCRDTSKTCLGGGMHCPSISTFIVIGLHSEKFRIRIGNLGS